MSSPSFSVDSLEFIAPNVIRVWYTDVPATTGISSIRADVAANYSVNPTRTITQASKVSEFDNAIDLYFTDNLVNLVYQVSVASTIQTVDGFTIQSPLVQAVDVNVLHQDALDGGAINEDANNLVLQFLNPAFNTKPNWQALAAGIGTGDALVRAMAENAFDQLSLASASSTYLDQRAGDRGVRRPLNIGMSDTLFRELAIAVSNFKLSQEAFLKVLEIFYGQPSVRGMAQSVLSAPFHLIDESTLRLLMDEKDTVDVLFSRSDFHIITQAEADEVAAVITYYLSLSGSNGFAVDWTDPETGESKVRIFSGRRGLASSVRVIGGTTQPALGFNQRVDTSDDVVVYPTWTITDQGNDVFRYAPSLYDAYNPANIEIGDYVVINGGEFNENNRGWLPIINVQYSFTIPGGLPDHWFEVSNQNGVAEVTDQYRANAIEIFRPKKHTTNDNYNPVSVSQQNGKTVIRIPATSQAVSRAKYSGAYVNTNDPVNIDTLDRDGAGLVTVVTTLPHGLSAGDWFTIQDFYPNIVTSYDGGLNDTFQAITASGTNITFQSDREKITQYTSGVANITATATGTTDIPGPFIFDPRDGFGIGATEMTVTSTLGKGNTYQSVDLGVNQALLLSNDGGYIVFNFGFSNQVGPVRYFKRLGNSSISIDSNFVFTDTVNSGDLATEAYSRTPFVPESPESVGSFYLTDSPAGRVAAEQTIRDISAAGIKLQIDIDYPLDRGLGNEGFPTKDNYKLSDVVKLWEEI